MQVLRSSFNILAENGETALPAIDRRFRGPADSSNGGYFAALVARLADEVMCVRLMRPPPLDTIMTASRRDGIITVRHGDVRVAEARPATLDFTPPEAPPYEVALDASLHHCDFERNPFPECFVCGPRRERGDGLRIYAAPWRDGVVAAPWVPDASLAGADGKVAPEFMWAALDCPGYAAARGDGVAMLLGEFTAHVDRCVHVGESCVVVGWPISVDGRKHRVGTALYDEDGELCARAMGLWIEPRL